MTISIPAAKTTPSWSTTLATGLQLLPNVIFLYSIHFFFTLFPLSIQQFRCEIEQTIETFHLNWVNFDLYSSKANQWLWIECWNDCLQCLRLRSNRARWLHPTLRTSSVPSHSPTVRRPNRLILLGWIPTSAARCHRPSTRNWTRPSDSSTSASPRCAKASVEASLSAVTTLTSNRSILCALERAPPQQSQFLLAKWIGGDPHHYPLPTDFLFIFHSDSFVIQIWFSSKRMGVTLLSLSLCLSLCLSLSLYSF